MVEPLVGVGVVNSTHLYLPAFVAVCLHVAVGICLLQKISGVGMPKHLYSETWIIILL